jgi:hypothetical protein
LTCPASLEGESLSSLRFCRRSGTCDEVRGTLGEAAPYGPGDGEVAGVALPAGKTPAPESGAAEEADPGDA